MWLLRIPAFLKISEVVCTCSGEGLACGHHQQLDIDLDLDAAAARRSVLNGTAGLTRRMPS